MKGRGIMWLEYFHRIIKDIIEKLEEWAKFNPQLITSCKSGTDFEIVVYRAAREIFQTHNLPVEDVDYNENSHRFPDIILGLNGEKYGIEVKSSSSKNHSWKINGNSILGSTKDKDVIETYIIFGKTLSENIAFKAGKYEDCVENVVVTHSPRYAIDMELPYGKSFFNQSGISYEEISVSDHPIQLVTDYFKGLGKKAWWLAESTPATFSYFYSLPLEKKNGLRAYAFVHFPEVLGTQQTKFNNFAVWMVTEKSIICSSLRDVFTGGGRHDIVCEKEVYSHMPHILSVLKECKQLVLEELENAETEKLMEDWNSVHLINDCFDEKFQAWVQQSSIYVGQSLYAAHIDVNPESFIRNLFDC